ncbi:hypothetical protein BDV33DRAFT_184300 [Aspergillus novoparasiticus]|uniref:Uncharacterized protein n=1 Tax=Aspergillus novoparasiticus TaxID=986946 RepID=A0A5N6E7W9_9EURO|nr:hypothetical protein BDV33DRAFT_184300 [Aspergillus novoparasiticus]
MLSLRGSLRSHWDLEPLIAMYVYGYISVTCQYTVRYWSFPPCSVFQSTSKYPPTPERPMIGRTDYQPAMMIGRVLVLLLPPRWDES